MAIIDQQLEDVPVDQLVPHPENPRRGNVDTIVQSIEANGWYGTIVAQVSSRRILVGNHRWMAAKALGLATVPVMWLDVDDERARRILLVDNRANDVAGYDTQALVDMLEQMLDSEGLVGTGYTPDDLDDLLAELDRVATTSPQPFGGGYSADEGAVDDHLGNGRRPGMAAQGLREVVLVFTEEDYTGFVGRVTKAKAAWQLDNTSAACLEALKRADL